MVMLHVVEIPHSLVPEAVVVPADTGAPVSLRDYAVSAAEAHLADLVARIARDGASVTGQKSARARPSPRSCASPTRSRPMRS